MTNFYQHVHASLILPDVQMHQPAASVLHYVLLKRALGTQRRFHHCALILERGGYPPCVEARYSSSRIATPTPIKRTLNFPVSMFLLKRDSFIAHNPHAIADLLIQATAGIRRMTAYFVGTISMMTVLL